MKIVVLAGGTSTERDVSIVSGTGICTGLRAKGHQAVLVGRFLRTGKRWTGKILFPRNMMWTRRAAYIKSFNAGIEKLKEERKEFFGPNVMELCRRADIVFLGTSRRQRRGWKSTGRFLTLWGSVIPAPVISAAQWLWIRESQNGCSR